MQTSILTIIFAIVAIVALVGVAFWLVHRFGSSRLGAGAQRGRMPRLAVIDAAAVDGRRRLVLVRRDNVEHLLMIGGPNDMIVEPNIVRATAAREQIPQRPGAAAEPPPRIAPLPETIGWSDSETARPEGFEHAEPQMPEPPPRPARPSFAEEARRPQLPERRAGPLADLTMEPLALRPEPRLEPRAEPRAEPRPEPRPEPAMPRMTRTEPAMPRPPRASEMPKAPARAPERAAAPPPPPPPPAPPVSSADQNLAEMAQRLEAALRRPAAEMAAPPVAPEPPAAVPPPRPARAEPAAPAPAKSTFENLEDEMASLLGRPKPPASS